MPGSSISPSSSVDLPATVGLNELELRRFLRRVLLAWVFGAGWLYLTTGAVLTRYARLLGVNEFGFGLMAAIPYAATLGQLPASFFIERYGHRKALFIIPNLLHRALWLVIALIPWVLPSALHARGLILLMLISTLAASLAVPSWYAWICALVPANIRGRYFSRRTQAGQIVGLVVTLAVGYLLDWAEGISRVVLAHVLSAVLALAAISGITDILFFLRIPDRPTGAVGTGLSFRQMVAEPLRNRSFRYYLAFAATFVFAIGFVGQFVWLYLLEVVGMSNAHANLLLILGPMVVALLGVPVWGRLIDRLGRKPVLIVAGICVIPGSVVWLLITREHWFPAYFIVILVSLAWPGIDLASFNILLGMTGRRVGSAYAAIHSLVVATAGTVSGLCSGALARVLRDWHGEFLGIPLTYHAVLFFLSAVLRGLALLWLRGVEEPRAFSVRGTFRIVAVNMYSNLQQTLFALFVPMRLVGRWTYKLLPGRRWLRWR